MSTGPISPPISAWDELEGRPNHQVIRFQAMAPISAATIRPAERAMAFGSNADVSMIFLPIVLATAVPKRKGPMNSQIAAMVSAIAGDMAPVTMIVATTFAASWNPLEKSKKSARATTITAVIRMELPMSPSPQSDSKARAPLH